MNKRAAALAVTFLVVGVTAGFFMYRTATNYDAATEAILTLSPSMVQVEEVRIPPITSMQETISVEVAFNVTNPTRQAILVWPISFKLYNDDVTDQRPFLHKLQDRLVNLGIATAPEAPYRLEPGISVTMEGTVLVGGIVGHIDVLNVTDPDGNYHPFITASMLAELADTGIKRDIEGILYVSGPEGVPPYEG